MRIMPERESACAYVTPAREARPDAHESNQTLTTKMKTKLISVLTAIALAFVFPTGAVAQIPAQTQEQPATSFAGLDFGSFQITSIVPTSFTSMDGAINLTVKANPYGKITITDATGIIYKQGTAFIIGKAEDVVIPAGQGSFNVLGHVSLASTEALMAVLRDPSINPSDYSADVKATVKIKGRTMIIEKQNLPLSRILKR